MSRSVMALLVVFVAGCAQRPLEAVRTKADFLYDHADYQAAAKEYTEIVDRYPGDWRAQYQLGLCKLTLDQPSEARQALEIANTNHPGDPDIADALAEAIFRQGDRSELFEFVRAQAESAQSVRAWLRVASYSAKLGDADSATAAFQTAILLDDGRTIEPYLEAAAYAETLGDTDEAIRRLRQAYSIRPRDQRITQKLTALGEVPGPTLALPPGR